MRAFYDNDTMDLLPIREDDEDFDDGMKLSKEPRSSALISDAEQDMAELKSLIGKLKTSTLVREEKDKLMSLRRKLSESKKEIEASKTYEAERELKMLRSDAKKKTIELMRAMKEREIRSVVKSVGAAEQVDLAFILDCTGSMGSYINAVKEGINNIVNQVQKTNENLKLRLGVVAYRDLCDGSKRFQVLDFVSSVASFKTFVNNLTATGGGDGPEDIAGALQTANGLSWIQATRISFLITDSPCHGSEYHRMSDDYPSGTPGIDVMIELKKLLSNKGNGSMTLYFGRITSHTDLMIDCFAKKGFTLEVVDVREATKMASCVTKSLRKSIFKTVTAIGGHRSVAFAPLPDERSLFSGAWMKSGSDISLKEYKIESRRPSDIPWDRQETVMVKVFRNEKIHSIEQLQKRIGVGMLRFTYKPTARTVESTMYLRVAREPFAEGETRIAYYGQLARTSAELNLEKNLMVVKSFKHGGMEVNDRRQYLKQMEVSTIASFLANKYNESKFRPGHCARIRFLEAGVVEETTSKGVKDNSCFCIEEALPTGQPFIKYSNNTGYWNEDHVNESLLRFTNYTYVVTGGYLMVTDLQGVSKEGGFILTDPVILCQDCMRFGRTNLGEKFMMRCIKSTRAILTENGWSYS